MIFRRFIFIYKIKKTLALRSKQEVRALVVRPYFVEQKFIFLYIAPVNITGIRYSNISNRDLSLMVKYETFNLCVVGSNPTGLIILLYLIYNILLV